MKFIQGWVNNRGVKIQYIDNGINDTKKATLLICSGLSESAEISEDTKYQDE